MKTKSTYVILLFLLYLNVYSQVGINTDQPEATLHILSDGNSSTTKALSIDNSSSSNLVTVLDDGRVGIGTDEPLTMLDVRGSISTLETSSTIPVGTNAVTVPSNTSFVKIKGLATETIVVTVSSGAEIGQRLVIFNMSDGGNTAMLNGYEIPNTQAVEFIFTEGNWRGTLGSKSTPDSGWNITGNANTNSTHFVGTVHDSPVRFRTNNSERMIITNNGNVGIGTDSPISLLEATGKITSSLEGDNNYDVFDGRVTSSNSFPVINLKRSRGGDFDNESYVQNGDTLGDLAFKNHSNNGGAEIKGVATENHTSSTSGTELQLFNDSKRTKSTRY